MLKGLYDPALVAVSILVAMLASYTALSMAGRVATSHGRTARCWIAGGAVAMGTGIWAMHFIGMLAFRLHIELGYDVGITFLSWMLPVAVSGLALWQVSQREFPLPNLLAGAVLMGIGINAMHYTGMAAMRMAPGIVYDGVLFGASVLIAIAASGAALWIAFRLRRHGPGVWLPRAGAAVVMGLAIVGMHYTGMAAAGFPAGSICLAARDGVSLDGLAALVTLGTLALLVIALLVAVFDARLEARSRTLAATQATSAERQALLEHEREARAEAERLNDMKDEFLAVVSHELRTPLNAIVGWTELLRRGASDEALRGKAIDTIERNARAQASLIDDLLDMSKIISGKVVLEPEEIDLVELADTAAESMRPQALAKTIRLDKALGDAPLPLAVDPRRLQQVLLNLLSNAIKFTPEGGRVTLSLRRAGETAQLAITDTGIGIAPDFLPHVFDRFRQADASTTRHYGGLGLGLAIVKHLVELHHGQVHVTSAGVDCGTTFTITLPLRQRLRAAQPRRAPRPAPVKAGLDGANILVIDDSPDTLELIERVLQDAGARVSTASSAPQALTLLREARPDVIVSDIGMPGMDGFELIRRVRALGTAAGGDVPAVALTAFTRVEDRRRAVEAGFSCHVSKPFNADELVTTVAGLAKEAG